MRKRRAVSLLLNGILAAGFLWTRALAQAGGGRGGNGDVNGDGAIDISDPVYLLTHLFFAGPAPVAIECPPATGQGLPDTGQTKCYDELGQEIPCDSETCRGQDGPYATGCPSEGRFVNNGDGTVTDNCTGLMWQKDTADVNGDGKVPEDFSDAVSWCAALAYCENLDFAGHNDWRLPNERELQSIVDYGRYSPAIDPVFGAVSVLYWSATSNAFQPDSVWSVHFFDGYAIHGLNDKGLGRYYVRAVRGRR